MGTVLEDALEARTNQLGKNPGELTPGQIAEVEANPQAYLPKVEPAPVEVPAEVVPEEPPPKAKKRQARPAKAKG